MKRNEYNSNVIKRYLLQYYIGFFKRKLDIYTGRAMPLPVFAFVTTPSAYNGEIRILTFAADSGDNALEFHMCGALV